MNPGLVTILLGGYVAVTAWVVANTSEALRYSKPLWVRLVYWLLVLVLFLFGLGTGSIFAFFGLWTVAILLGPVFAISEWKEFPSVITKDLRKALLDKPVIIDGIRYTVGYHITQLELRHVKYTNGRYEVVSGDTVIIKEMYISPTEVKTFPRNLK